jgi:hypothetical protein
MPAEHQVNKKNKIIKASPVLVIDVVQIKKESFPQDGL